MTAEVTASILGGMPRIVHVALGAAVLLYACRSAPSAPDDAGTSGSGGGYSAEVAVDCSGYDPSNLELVARGCPCNFSGQGPFCCQPGAATFDCRDGIWWAWFGDDYCNRGPGGADAGLSGTDLENGVAGSCEPAEPCGFGAPTCAPLSDSTCPDGMACSSGCCVSSAP